MRGLVSIALLSLPFAGCLDALPFLSDDEAPAGQVRDEADDAARAWQPEARLTSVFGMEGDMSEWTGKEFPSDPDVGNGEAPAWVFSYAAAGRELTLVVAANGTIVERHEDEDDEADTLGDWSAVDSDDAMEVARGDERFDSAVSEGRGVGLAVSTNESGTHWALFTMGPRFAVAIVDAREGRLLGVYDLPMGDWSDANWDWDWDWGGWGSGGDKGMDGEKILYEDTRDGTFASGDLTANEPFDAPPGATRVDLRVSSRSVVLDPAVTVALLGPDGEEIEPDDAEDGAYSYDVDLPGPYVARIAPEQGTTTFSYELTIEVWGYE